MNNQTNQIDNLISAGVDMIILGAADSKGIAPAVKRAKEAGIVVIAVDVAAEGGVDATVMSDNKQAGQQAGQYIVDKLKGKGQMVIVNGPPISSQCKTVWRVRSRCLRNTRISRSCLKTKMLVAVAMADCE